MCWCMHIPDSCQSTTSPVSDAYVYHSGYQVGQAIGVDTYVNMSVMNGTLNMCLLGCVSWQTHQVVCSTFYLLEPQYPE